MAKHCRSFRHQFHRFVILYYILLTIYPMSTSKLSAVAFSILQRNTSLGNRKRNHWMVTQPYQPALLPQHQHQTLPIIRHQRPISPITLSVASFSRNRGGRYTFVTPQWLLNALSNSINDDDVATTTTQAPAGENEVDPGIVEGTDLRILKYPHASLRAKNEMVTMEEIQNGSIAKIAREMFLIMYAAQGVGLAAPQVGVNKRLMVYNESGDRSKWLNEVILINPVITEFSDTLDIEIEGCLSFPQMNGSVERSKWIKVEAMNLKGKTIKKKYKGWEARIFQHEYDHLDGIVYIDRLINDENKQTVVEPRLKELIQQHDTERFGAPAL
jgi:peptide deformylase